MSPHHSDQISQRSKVSWVTLWQSMACLKSSKIKGGSVTQWQEVTYWAVRLLPGQLKTKSNYWTTFQMRFLQSPWFITDWLNDLCFLISLSLFRSMISPRTPDSIQVKRPTARQVFPKASTRWFSGFLVRNMCLICVTINCSKRGKEVEQTCEEVVLLDTVGWEQSPPLLPSNIATTL